MEPSMKKQENAKGVVKATASAAKGLRELFEVGLNDIYYAEKVMTKSLPKMVENASSPELVTALKNHLAETEEHVSRLEKIFKSTGIKTVAKKSNAMEGLIKESEVTMKETELGNVRDAGIIAAGQKVEHYEIATYGTLRTLASNMGHTSVVDLLQQTLDNEKETDVALTVVAERFINEEAAAE